VEEDGDQSPQCLPVRTHLEYVKDLEEDEAPIWTRKAEYEPED